MAHIINVTLVLGLGLSLVVGLHVQPVRPASSLWGGGQVMYGFEACDQAWSNKAMEAAQSTYLADVPRDRIVIVGGIADDNSDGVDKDPNPCEDKKSGLACKEAVMLYRAHARMENVGANWLIVGQEDKYINTEEMERWLSNKDTTVPSVFSSFGCGRSWNFTAKALGKINKTTGQVLSTPRGWVNPSFSCQAVWENGGMCGGPTYAINRKALEKLHKEGQTMAEYIEDFMSAGSQLSGCSDISSSCFMFKRGVEPHGNEMYSSVAIDGLTPYSGSVREAVARYPKAITYHLDVGGFRKAKLAEIIFEIHSKVETEKHNLNTSPRSLVATDENEKDWREGEPFYLQYPDLVWPKN